MRIALAPFTDAIAYLEDGDWAVLTREGHRHPRPERQCGRAAGRPARRRRAPRRQGQSPPLHGEGNPRAARGDRPHARGLCRSRHQPRRHSRSCLSTSPNLSRLSISACGTAFYAGLVAKYWFERWARLPVDVDIASEFRYRETALDAGGAALFVSQSGETADTLATLRYCRAQGQHICRSSMCANRPSRGNPMSILPTLAGPEIGVASTKAFTCQLTVLACLAIAAGKARGRDRSCARGRARAGARRGAAPHGDGAARRAALRDARAIVSRRRATCSISGAD